MVATITYHYGGGWCYINVKGDDRKQDKEEKNEDDFQNWGLHN